MSPQARLQLLTGLGLVGLLGLGARLYHLTVLQHEELRVRAERRQRRAEVLPARRGRILDRHDQPLAMDSPVDDVALYLPEVDPSLELVTPLARAIQRPRAEALGLLRRARDEVGPGGRAEVLLATVPVVEAERARRVLRGEPGLHLTAGEEGLRIAVLGEVFAPRRRTIARLAALLGRPPAELAATVDAAVDAIHAVDDRYERIARWQRPLVVAEDASFEVVARVTERAFELPGVTVRRRFVRRYPQGDVAGHLVGFLGAPTAEEAARDRARILDGDRDALGFLLGERRSMERDFRLRDEPYGRRGVEASRDGDLRGTPGIRVLIRDARNRTRRVLLDIPPRDGDDVRLTLDTDLQLAAQEALDAAVAAKGSPDAGGAAVVLDVRTGDVLALASAPRFDPNRLGADYAALVEDPRTPLLHRAVLPFTPGSTWKVLSAFAIFDRSVEQPLPRGWTTSCGGRLFRNSRAFACDGIHHTTGLEKALERSCNVYFFRAADIHGLDVLARFAQEAGMGEPLARGLPGERGGLVPFGGYKAARADRQAEALAVWSRRVGEAARDPFDAAGVARALGRFAHCGAWYRLFEQDRQPRPGDARNAIIGQGDVLATPVQVAFIAQLVATGGRVPVPRIDRDAPIAHRDVALDPAILREVRAGMRRCVTRGTASASSIGLRALDVAGKTGTAERRKGEPKLAWFMGYYPTARPEIAFAVLVDRTEGHGGDVCGPVARRIVETWSGLARGGAK